MAKFLIVLCLKTVHLSSFANAQGRVLKDPPRTYDLATEVPENILDLKWRSTSTNLGLDEPSKVEVFSFNLIGDIYRAGYIEVGKLLPPLKYLRRFSGYNYFGFEWQGDH